MSEILNALNQIDKLLPEAKQQLRQMSPDYKVPAGIFEGKIKKFELVMLKSKLALKCTFGILTHPDTNYNGCEAQTVMFLSSAFGTAKVMELFVKIGVTEAGKVARGKEFQNLVNAANKVTSVFAIDLSYDQYEGKDYARMRIVRKLSENVEISPEPEVSTAVENIENIENVENVENVVETTEDSKDNVIDDFKEDFGNEEPMYEEESIPELPLDEPEETGKYEKYQKKLAMFCFVTFDMNVKDKTADEIIQIIKDKKDFYDVKEIERSEKTLLKNVGILS